MVIIYGTRSYGRVDQHEGEYASTSFFHVYYLPLVPTGSSWVTSSDGAGPRGYSIPLYGKSVLATYLRIWGLILGVVCTVKGLDGSPGVLALGIAALAASAWAWSWRSRRGARALRRSDLNYVAYGARCEPARMPSELRNVLKHELDRRWAAREPSRSPNEVAQHGSTDPHEIAIAYGLLRIGGVERGRAGHAEHADADRILDSEHVAATAIADGPYRAAAGGEAVAASSSTLSDLVAARVAATHRAVTPEQIAFNQKVARRTRRRWRLGMVGVGIVAIGGITTIAGAIAPRARVALAKLQAVHPPIGEFVRVTCDTDIEPYLTETTSDGKVTARIYMCTLGAHYLPVRFNSGEEQAGASVEGKLRLVPETAPWVQELQDDGAVENRTLEVFVDVGDSRRFTIAVGGVMLAISAFVVFVFFGWRKRNAALLA